MTEEERRESRRKNEDERRKENREKRCEVLGGIEYALSYDKLYDAGKLCCNGERWKRSTTLFENDLFGETAYLYEQIENGTWKPYDYKSFTIYERGKKRNIDAPHIKDRQIEKAYTTNVLWPLYAPTMIYNNGASQKGKGLSFAFGQLRKDLRHHFHLYGREGWVINADISDFFASGSHDVIMARHEKYITDPKLKELADKLTQLKPGEKGMPLGLEPSQAEMVAYTSALDNYMKCQMSLKGFGHYMDDYYMLIPPDRDPNEILKVFTEKAEEIGLTVGMKKTKIIPLTRKFKYCKATFKLTETGKVITVANKKGITRAIRKIKKFKEKYDAGEMTLEEVYQSLQSILAGFKKYNNHSIELKIKRFFYMTFGFEFKELPERVKREREEKEKKEKCNISFIDDTKENVSLDM